MLNIDRKYLMNLDESALKKQRLIMRIIAVLLLLGGIFCLINPLASGVVLSKIIGILLLLSGIALIVGMVTNRRAHDLWPMVTGILLGVAYIVMGYVFVTNPAIGMISLAVVLAVLFAFGGVMRLITGFKTWKMPGAWLQILLGVLDLVITYLLVSAGPLMSITMVTTLVGIEMLFSSFSCFMVASLYKRDA